MTTLIKCNTCDGFAWKRLALWIVSFGTLFFLAWFWFGQGMWKSYSLSLKENLSMTVLVKDKTVIILHHRMTDKKTNADDHARAFDALTQLQAVGYRGIDAAERLDVPSKTQCEVSQPSERGIFVQCYDFESKRAPFGAFVSKSGDYKVIAEELLDCLAERRSLLGLKNSL
ncbi:MAG: hypothetical protein ABI747_04105 [Candidatus Moraniibacteriota bacterium]